MKHKHRWQFVRICDKPYEFSYIPEYKFPVAEFICECGKVKIVEVKR